MKKKGGKTINFPTKYCKKHFNKLGICLFKVRDTYNIKEATAILDWAIKQTELMPKSKINNIYLEGTNYDYDDIVHFLGNHVIAIEQRKKEPNIFEVHIGKMEYLGSGYFTISESHRIDLVQLLYITQHWILNEED